MSYVHLTQKSRNKKTGPIPVSTSSQNTCPDACPLKKNGCYADGGPLFMFWRKVTQKQRGVEYRNFIKEIENLPLGAFWRHNQAGDLMPQKNTKKISLTKLRQLYKANDGKKGFTFTHFDCLKYKDNRTAIQESNENGFTVNLSGNDLHHADVLADLDIGPVVSILPIEYERKKTETVQDYRERLKSLRTVTKSKRKIVVCPATYLDSMTCKKCKLCAKSDRSAIIGFPAHGVSKKKAQSIYYQGATI